MGRSQSKPILEAFLPLAEKASNKAKTSKTQQKTFHTPHGFNHHQANGQQQEKERQTLLRRVKLWITIFLFLLVLSFGAKKKNLEEKACRRSHLYSCSSTPLKEVTTNTTVAGTSDGN